MFSVLSVKFIIVHMQALSVFYIRDELVNSIY